jgi:hypothetical protein
MRKNTDAQISGGVADGSDEGSVMGPERSSDVVPTEHVGQPGNGEEPASAVKPFGIAKRVVWEAYQHVRANRGAAGIDGESIEMFEANLQDNLFRVWNRMSSGSYFPPAIRLVEIPKKTGGVRTLGISTVSDRIAQTVAKIYIEPALEQLFHPDSYGYRPGKSALQAIGVTRERCWKYDWVVEFDIQRAFDQPSQYPPQEPTYLSKVRRFSLPALSFRSALSVAGRSGKRYSLVCASRTTAMVPLWMRS